MSVCKEFRPEGITRSVFPNPQESSSSHMLGVVAAWDVGSDSLSIQFPQAEVTRRVCRDRDWHDRERADPPANTDKGCALDGRADRIPGGPPLSPWPMHGQEPPCPGQAGLFVLQAVLRKKSIQR